MTETLWLAGMLFANLWATGGISNLENDTTGAAAGALAGDATARPLPPVVAPPALPMQEWVGDRIEERASGDARTPILPPIKAGEKPVCEKPPTQEEILRALPTVARGIPYVYEQYRDELEFTIEKLVDRVDAPRFFPLIGTAQLHHCHWKCTVYFTDVFEITYPLVRLRTRRAEVVYIDTDRLHLCEMQKKNNVAAVCADMTSEPPLSCPGGQYRPLPKVVPSEAEESSEPPISRPILPAPTEETRSQAMTINDVIKMSKAGVAQKIILRQMELTNAVFNLTADDIVQLHEQGVNSRLISAMQERREEVKLVAPPAMSKYTATHWPDAAFETPVVAPKKAITAVSRVTPFWVPEIRHVADTLNDGKKLPGLAGRVYLEDDGAKQLIEANGSIYVEMYDRTSNTPVKLADWRFNAESLKSLKKSDIVGMGYTLFLPWESYRPEITQVEIRVLYMPEDGSQPQHAEPEMIRLRTAESVKP